MMTAGERLVDIAGRGGQAGDLLRSIGFGATAGQALVSYSGLPFGTAAQHLLSRRQRADEEAWFWSSSAAARRKKQRVEEEEMLLLGIL